MRLNNTKQCNVVDLKLVQTLDHFSFMDLFSLSAMSRSSGVCSRTRRIIFEVI